MATTTQTGEFAHFGGRPRHTPQILMGGSAIEGLGGIGAVVLAIIGLAGLLPAAMAAIATIVVGAGLLFEGGAIAARYNRILAMTAGKPETEKAEYGSGMTSEFVGGGAGIVLGILALIGIAPAVLLEVAVIVFGATLLLSAGSTAKLASFGAYYRMPGEEHRVMREAADSSIKAAAGAQVLIGIAAVVLGILALLGMQPLTLTLIGLLAVGASLLFSGSVVGMKTGLLSAEGEGSVRV